MINHLENAKTILSNHWGYDNFRGIQEAVIQSVMNNQDTLALMPTGGGKSICFQVAGLLKGGITLVISPLVALMQDQVEQLHKRNIKAISISSANSESEIDRLLDNCVYGKISFLYVSPERLSNELFLVRLAKMKVNLIAVDEAHCISQWGYDFRPAYLSISSIRPIFPKTPILALTASATKTVQTDICEQLEFSTNNQIIGQSFARNNLAYVGFKSETKEKRLLEILNKVPGTAVIYTRNRKNTKLIASFLNKRNIPADYYHAGLNTQLRSKKQHAWINDQTRVMVATNAFGMGIDKAEVRVVVHMDVPESPEAYFQEAGRAGRDGKKAYAVLLWNDKDIERLKLQFQQKYPAKEALNKLYQKTCSLLQIAVGELPEKPFSIDISSFAEKCGIPSTMFLKQLKTLEWCGFLRFKLKGNATSTIEWLSDTASAQRLSEKSKLIAYLIRSNGNFFEHAISINEKQMAKSLDFSMELLTKKLNELHQKGWINYLPASKNGSIELLVPRAQEKYFQVPAFLYKTLKKQDEERLAFMLSYLDADTCRSVLLLSYFGEQEIDTCGKCEICTEYHHQLSEKDKSKYTEQVKNYLIADELGKRELIEKFKTADHVAIKTLIRLLLDEKLITLTANSKLRWNK